MDPCCLVGSQKGQTDSALTLAVPDISVANLAFSLLQGVVGVEVVARWSFVWKRGV